MTNEKIGEKNINWLSKDGPSLYLSSGEGHHQAYATPVGFSGILWDVNSTWDLEADDGGCLLSYREIEKLYFAAKARMEHQK